MSDLDRAWQWRQERGVLTELEAVRVFHGPGEGTGLWKQLALDRFGNHFWITVWEGRADVRALSGCFTEIEAFLRRKSAASAVLLARPERGLPEEARVLFGTPPAEAFEVRERDAAFLIRLSGVRHPGLFLDHLPLRDWLRARMKGLRVLNTFAYTGSLSVAAGLGGADHVTTLDLSKPTVKWAEENWTHNRLPPDRARFIAGDVFEWLPRLRKSEERYDCVILDPPSFSRGKKGVFSTSKDLERLHGLAMDLLAPGGFLVSSINSAEIPRPKYEQEVFSAARSHKLRFQVLDEITQPETFPTTLGASAERYLKGWVLKSS